MNLPDGNAGVLASIRCLDKGEQRPAAHHTAAADGDEGQRHARERKDVRGTEDVEAALENEHTRRCRRGTRP